ncbi:hypothetical protein [Maricaulis sp. MIT060901]|uniref:hypothetical protein n=1 Tax=Maricaulis sp. MIT060901 TaxID=3096993 RepID=UPI00399BE16D
MGEYLSRLASFAVDVFRFLDSAVRATLNSDGQAAIGVVVIALVALIAVWILHKLYRWFRPLAKASLPLTVVEKSNAKDDTAIVHGTLVSFKNKDPVRIQVSEGPFARKAKVTILLRYGNQVDKNELLVDQDTFAKLFPDHEGDDRRQTANINLKADNGLWDHPNFEVRIGARMTVVFFVLSIIASVAIEVMFQ